MRRLTVRGWMGTSSQKRGPTKKLQKEAIYRKRQRVTAEQQFTIEIVKWIVVLVGIISISATIIGVIAFWRTTVGAAKKFSLLIQRGSIVRLTAIFAIIFATFILCVAGLLKPELAASIFSGIAGYVLGGAATAVASANGSEKENSN